ncbi:MAG: hypothetical protein Q4B52_07960 [Tissierellia bacterium]|nr:hypothetical protein [Tissierellia bacterium]
MDRKDWVIILALYLSFWLYLAIDRYINKKRILSEELSKVKELKLSDGDQILTTDGIYATVVSIDKNIIKVD